MLGDLLYTKLYNEKFDVDKVSDTSEAMKILENTIVDLILLDIVLPGIDGLTFIEEIRQKDNFKSIPFVVLSNYGKKEYIERSMAAGAVDYLIKSNSSPKEIIERVRTIFAV